ncbi:MAG: LPP20 family lipoprotein [Archangium sp.]|nr:LPP20 family lipoprotein [Archangium sp.]
MKRFVLAVVLVPLIVVAQGKDAKADPSKPQPGVNWAGQVVRATGQGAPDLKAQNPAQARLGAERAALADALRNLLAQVKGVSVDGTRKVSDLMEKDEIRTRVEGLVRGYKIINKRYFSDSGVEVEIEVPLAMFTDVVDPDTTQMFAAPPAKPVEADKSNTGLVIDARGLKVVPSLMPRVLDEGGKPVYSIDFLSTDARKQSAVAAYVQNIDDAQKSQKAGEKPLVLKAARATGADLQLAPEDARKLAALNTSFLAAGKVVIVLN